MPFDPTKPSNNSPIVSAELRDQLNSLKALIDAQAAQIADLQSQVTEMQGALDGKATAIWNVSEFDAPISDPPVFDNVSDVVAKLNEVINGLKA